MFLFLLPGPIQSQLQNKTIAPKLDIGAVLAQGRIQPLIHQKEQDKEDPCRAHELRAL